MTHEPSRAPMDGLSSPLHGFEWRFREDECPLATEREGNPPFAVWPRPIDGDNPADAVLGMHDRNPRLEGPQGVSRRSWSEVGPGQVGGCHQAEFGVLP